jgi:hypothetical protein
LKREWEVTRNLNILHDIDKNMGTRISLVKQLGLPVSTLNTAVKHYTAYVRFQVLMAVEYED